MSARRDSRSDQHMAIEPAATEGSDVTQAALPIRGHDVRRRAWSKPRRDDRGRRMVDPVEEALMGGERDVREHDRAGEFIGRDRPNRSANRTHTADGACGSEARDGLADRRRVEIDGEDGHVVESHPRLSEQA